MTSSEGHEARERIIRFVADCGVRIAEQVIPIEHGIAVRTPSKPAVYSLNYVRIRRPAGFDEIAALCERYQADLPYRYAIVEPESTIASLDPAFSAAGWEPDRDLMMVLTGTPDREARTDLVREIDEDEWLSLMARWHRDEDQDTDPAVIDQLERYNRELGHALGDRRFGVFLDGQVAAITMLRKVGAVAQVEDVYTAPEARNRGFARALVTRAVELARAEDAEMIFILADAAGWPRQLYAKIGFEPVGESRTYLRKPKRSWRNPSLGARARPPGPSAP